MTDRENDQDRIKYIISAFEEQKAYFYDTDSHVKYSSKDLLFDSEAFSGELLEQPWSFPYMLKTKNRYTTKRNQNEKGMNDSSDRESQVSKHSPIKKLFKTNGIYPSEHLCDIGNATDPDARSHVTSKKDKSANNHYKNNSTWRDKENNPGPYNTEEIQVDRPMNTLHARYNVDYDKLYIDQTFLGLSLQQTDIRKELQVDQIYNYLCVCEDPGCTVTAFGNCKSLRKDDDKNDQLYKLSAAHSRYIKNDFKIDISAIQENRDKRTTCMLKNIPNKYTQSMLRHLLDEHHYDRYDFLYLRMDYKNKCNVGYAFINFVDCNEIPSFYEKVNFKGWKKFRSHKIAELTYASIQGLFSLIKKFRKNAFTCESEELKPKIWVKNPDVLKMI